MSQTISITNKPVVYKDITWRSDGENDQIILLHRPDLALPQILNPTAAKIFSLCTGENTTEDIATKVCDEFQADDYSAVLEDVKNCLTELLDRKIIKL